MRRKQKNDQIEHDPSISSPQQRHTSIKDFFKICQSQEKTKFFQRSDATPYLGFAIVHEMVPDVEGAERLGHVVGHDAETVAKRAEKLPSAGAVHVELAVGVNVLPRQVLHVPLRQAPDEIVIEDPACNGGDAILSIVYYGNARTT